MQIQVRTFSMLKDHFPERFELEVPAGGNVQDLIATLKEMKPEAELLLENCTYSLESDLIDKNYQIHDGETIYFLPPSSGG